MTHILDIGPTVANTEFKNGAAQSATLAGHARRFYGTLAGWLAAFARSQRMASMQAFAAGDERALKDLGISRAQANYIADRPVWGRSSALAIDPDRPRGLFAMPSSTLEISSRVVGLVRSPSGSRLSIGTGHVRRVWSVWRARARDRRAWARADDHILRDVGLTRAELLREVSKPCWRR